MAAPNAWTGGRNALAALLGFDLPGRGQSKPEQAGIPGCCGSSRGEGQSLSAPAGHAQGHLREALTRLSGELAAGDGDRLFERVRRARRAAGRAQRSKGVFKDADEALARARSARDDAARQGAVGRGRRPAGRPAPGTWAGAASRALEGAGSATVEARTRLAPWRATRRWKACAASWRRPPATWACCRIRSGATSRMKPNCGRWNSRRRRPLERLRQSERRCACNTRRATRRRRRARLALTAGAQADRRDLEQQLRQLDADTERLDGALKAADELIAQGSALKAEVVGIEVPDADLQGLRGIESQRASLRAQLSRGHATVVPMEPGARALLDGRELEVDGLLLTAAAGWNCPAWAGCASSRAARTCPRCNANWPRWTPKGRRCWPAWARPASMVEARHARMPRSRAIWKACAGRCRSTRPGHRHAARPARRTHGARCAGARLHAAGRRRRAGPRLGAAGPERGGGCRRTGQCLGRGRRAADAEATRAQMLQSQATARRTALLSPERVAQQERAGRLAETRSHHDLLARRLGEAEAALDGQRRR